MSLQYVKQLIPLQNAVYKTITDDGLILGHGYIDKNWLNRTHRHTEGTNQWAYIEHLPPKYVEKRIDTNRKMIDNFSKFLETVNKVLEKLTKSPKSQFVMAGTEGILTAAQDEEIITMQELEALMADPYMQEYIKYVTLAQDEEPSKEGFGTMASGGDSDLRQILVIVQIAIALLQEGLRLLGSVQDELVRNVSNPDGSLTIVIADYYHGTARTIRHVGWFGIPNNINTVRQRGDTIRRMGERPEGGFNLKGRRIYVGL